MARNSAFSEFRGRRLPPSRVIAGTRSEKTIKAIGIGVLFCLSTGVLAEPLALQQVRDAAHRRTWVLLEDALYLRSDDGNTRRFELPGWLYAKLEYACAPDVAVDGDGAALVSSNVVPTLWRVDPREGRVTVHEIALGADAGREVGFTRLSYSCEEGVLYAVSAAHGSLWRIDPSLRRAEEIASSGPRSCARGGL